MSDPLRKYVMNAEGFLEAPNARADWEALFDASGETDFVAFTQRGVKNPDNARFLKRRPEIDGEHPVLSNSKARAKYLEKHGEAATLQFLRDNGLRDLGDFKDPSVPDADKIKGAKNPWSKEWRGTDAARQAKQIEIIKSSASLAAQLAKAAGVTLSGQKLRGA